MYVVEWTKSLLPTKRTIADLVALDYGLPVLDEAPRTTRPLTTLADHVVLTGRRDNHKTDDGFTSKEDRSINASSPRKLLKTSWDRDVAVLYQYLPIPSDP